MLIKSLDKDLDGDELITPDDIVKQCLKIHGFNFITLDICADQNNTKADMFISKRINALTRNWIVKKQKKTNKDFVIWVNAPHSQNKEFVEKACEQWQRCDMNIVMLLPVNTLTSNYAKKFIHPFCDISWKMFLGRIKFIDPRTNLPSAYNSVNGYATICFKSKRKRELDSFHSI